MTPTKRTGKDGTPRRLLTPLLAAAVVGAVAAVGVAVIPPALERRARRAELAEVSALARPLPEGGESGDYMLRAPLTSPGILFFARDPRGDNWILVGWDGSGLVLDKVRDGLRVGLRRLTPGARAVELSVYRTGHRLDFHFGGRTVGVTAPPGWPWRVVDIRPDGAQIQWQVQRFRTQLKRDAFMRTQFGVNDGWAIEEGAWQIRTQGAGAGKSANAFVLEGLAAADAATSVCTGWQLGANYTAEVSAKGVSAGASYWLEAGNPDGGQAAFGWSGPGRCWQLVARAPDGATRVLLRLPQANPPGNWRRIGLTLDTPFKVRPLLDGAPLGSYSLREPVFGQVRLRATGGAVDFDDFHLRGRDAPAEEGTPLFAESETFREKPIEGQKDQDFVKWVHDTLVAQPVAWTTSQGTAPGLRYSIPLYGDFTYEGSPAGAGRMALRLETETGEQRDYVFRRSGASWRPDDGEPPSDPGPESKPLRVVYSGGRLSMIGSAETALSDPPGPGPLYISLCALDRPVAREQHVVRSATLWNEFFETAPAGWVWWSGNVGMQSRWACQPGWNWMGGWSRNFAAGFSRAAYSGDQTIEYYTSMKDLIAGQGSRRYMRRDLNFSFCTDGRNASSGYSLLFGGFGNSGTYLMKGDKVLAHTGAVGIPRFRGGENDVHWRWWHVKIEKRGGRIRVRIDEQPLFDVVDPDPLPGGHLAFWTVRGGFTLARVRVAAQDRQWRPQASWSEPSETGGGWEPVEPGAVRVARAGQQTRVVNRAGGGTFAVRWTGGPIDLSKTPVFTLPFQAGPGARVSLHLQISGVGYLLPVTAPVENTPLVLCPLSDAFPQAPLFLRMTSGLQVPEADVLPPVAPRDGLISIDLLEALAGRAGAAPRLESLIVGNASNKDYLLAGFGGNGAGSHYTVGTPHGLAREQHEGRRGG